MGTPFDPASPQAAAIRDLFSTTLLVCAVIFVVVTFLVAYCVIRFRATKGSKAEPAQIEGNTRLEMAWTAAPILIIAYLLVQTMHAMELSDPPSDRAPDVTVIGHQWWWEARYPSGAITANEIHLPTGKPLVVRVESSDVIHDFWVPELGRKIDATPGHPVQIWMQADRAGEFTITCAEYCGVQHAWMRGLVVAESPEAFAQWERHQREPSSRPTESAAVRGAATFAAMTCVRCHAVAPTSDARVAPDLTHIASRKLLAGGVLPDTPGDLRHWLQEPQVIKEGSHMPDAQLTDAQVDDLVAYFETLR
jgi:cytochrome c oxidase subunit 2